MSDVAYPTRKLPHFIRQAVASEGALSLLIDVRNGDYGDFVTQEAKTFAMSRVGIVWCLE